MTHTRRLTFLAILSALSFVLMYVSFPLIPGASFLKLDFSVIPMLLALALFDFKSSVAVLFLRSLLKLILNNHGVETYIGLPMNIIALFLFLWAFAFIWKKRMRIEDYLKATVLGTFVLTVAMVVLNLFYAMPLYAEFANFDIAKILGTSRYIVAMVVPFNIAEGVILALIFYIVYTSCKPFIERYQLK
ncbi:ECF transporter S component [Streptococcus sciuri]|uniref:Riboflavin transporter n=1 Tax=Streptococcus sciuri TaxID=2973939 RepID=A0ABT2F8K9_9STRE|nr:ECF transporter S component [Streptococcus sciuri]MCS4488769.1 ECF transporter S component [Streptococcus sciuri]